MQTHYFTVFVLFSLFIALTTQTQKEPSQIIEVFRHGARGPLSGYDKSWQNHEFGALTASGTRQHFILGKTLAKKYPKFFSKAYNPLQVYVLSDTTIRCVQSAQAHLDGIFEGKGLSFRNDFASEVAVPPFVDPAVQETVASISHSSALPSFRIPTIVNIVDATNSVIFQRNRGASCPNGYSWEVQNARDAKAQEAWNKIFRSTIDNVNSYLEPKQEMKGNLDIAAFGDAVLVNIYDNRTLPGNITDPDLIKNLTSTFSWFVFHVEYGQLIQRQLSAYHTVEAMLNELIAFRQGVKYHQVAMFSGHDYNLYALLAAFNIVTEECLMENFLSYAANKTTPHPHCVFPHFAANIILEFYNHTSQVKFLYNNMVIPICKGQETCDYEEFLVIARNATGNNTFASFQEKCGLNVTNQGPSYERAITEDYSPENNLNYQKDLILGAIPTKVLLVALGIMTLFCLILLAKLIAHKRSYSVLIEEVKEKRVQFDLEGDVGTDRKASKPASLRELDLLA